jgi:hypothetical protein
MKTPRIKKLFILGLFIKVTVTLMLIIIAAVLLLASLGVFSNDHEPDLADKISYCDRSYYDRDFSELYSTLTAFDLYTGEFDKYWEAVDAYRAYTQVLEWRVALENGYDGADTKLKQAQKELSELEKTVKFPENRSLIDFLNTKLNDDNG